MRLPGENEERGRRLSLKYTVMGVSLSILLVLGAVFLENGGNKTKEKERNEAAVLALEHDKAEAETEGGTGASDGEGAAAENGSGGTDAAVGEDLTVYDGDGRTKDIEKLYREHKLTADDLDLWNRYPRKNPELVKVDGTEAGEEEKEKDGTEEKSKSAKDRFEEAEEKQAEEEKKDPAKDGKHTLLTYEDGTEEWVLTSPYLEKNTYDFTNLTMKADKMAYYEDGKQTSLLGVDLSKYNKEVDFEALKEAGMDFAMIRLGARGYGSGQILLDEKFTDYMSRAAGAGLDTGVYFFSQAVSAQEAVEEANFVIQNLAAYHITWPIAFDMEYVENDTARIEALSREEKTTVAKAFLDTVKAAGYKPMLYGNKAWLIKELDLTKLTGYDIWLSEQTDVPDYPYQFQMWQYTLDGDVRGVDGDVNLNISFVDYTEK